jgi:DNA end-binding protein Ku
MARSLWSGSIAFGLVNIPIRLFTAQRDHEVSFHQLHAGTTHRVRYKKVDEETGRELDADDIVMGYEFSKGKWVTVTDEELEKLRPRSTRTLEIEDFVELGEIDPIYFERTYFVAPQDEASARAYGLLLKAMQEQGRAGIGKVVIRNKQYLAAVRPYEDILVMSTMRFADEVVSVGGIDDLHVNGAKPDAKSMKLATSLIDSLAGHFDPAKYHDTYTEELRALLQAKAKGKEIKVEEAPEPSAKVTDLMAALEASVDAARNGRSARRGGKRASTSTKTAAGKRSGTKAPPSSSKRTSARKKTAA